MFISNPRNTAFRVVFRNLHPSTPITEIGIAIQDMGFLVQQVSTVLHKSTKILLLVFFIGPKPAEINKDILNLIHIIYTKIKVEEPHKRREIIQCFNWQEHGHSKSYCSHPPKCVHCAAAHSTSSCTQSKPQLSTYILCEGNHPASHRSCTIHKERQLLHNTSTNSKKNVIINKNIIVNEEGDPIAKTHSGLPNIMNNKVFPNILQLHPPKTLNCEKNLKQNPPEELRENSIILQFFSIISEFKLLLAL